MDINFHTFEEVKNSILNKAKPEAKRKEPTKRKVKFKPPQLSNIERHGIDYRKGRDISGNDMLRIFGFAAANLATGKIKMTDSII